MEYFMERHPLYYVSEEMYGQQEKTENSALLNALIWRIIKSK